VAEVVVLRVRLLGAQEVVDKAAQVVQVLRQVLLIQVAEAAAAVMPLIFILAQTAALAS
jgi:hypothetical protein